MSYLPMSYFLSFALTFGGVLALSAVVAAILIRSADVRLAWKMILPGAILGPGLYAPFAVDAMLGRPIATTFAALPERGELVAYVARDEARLVDLWLMDGGPVPRSYEIPLDARTRKTLRQASEQLARGAAVALRKARAMAKPRFREQRRRPIFARSSIPVM
jgi:hypothetical protein